MHKNVQDLFSPWMQFSRKLSGKIENPRFVGCFFLEEAEARGMRLATGCSGDKKQGLRVQIYWLVDESDGVIADAKFQVLGPPALIGLAEACSEFMMRKNYDQAHRVTAELIDKQLRDKKDKEAIPKEAYRSLNLVLEAAFQAAEKCMDIPLSESYVPTPMQPIEGEPRLYPGWDTLNVKQKISVIEEIIATEIRPYIELDAGGIEIVSLVGSDLTIAYKGACTTCPSSTGSTLQAIQQILSIRVHPELRVIPDSSFLHHG